VVGAAERCVRVVPFEEYGDPRLSDCRHRQPARLPARWARLQSVESPQLAPYWLSAPATRLDPCYRTPRPAVFAAHPRPGHRSTPTELSCRSPRVRSTTSDRLPTPDRPSRPKTFRPAGRGRASPLRGSSLPVPTCLGARRRSGLTVPADLHVRRRSDQPLTTTLRTLNECSGPPLASDPPMRFGDPPAFEATGSDLHRSYQLRLCSAFRLSRPLDALLRPWPFRPCLMPVTLMGFAPSEVFPRR
jgi:hypothetical protein